MVRQIQEQLGLQPGSPGAKEMSLSQGRGWVNVHDTQSPTSLTIGDALEESCPLVTGDNLQSNRNESLGDNSVQQAPSTPEGEGSKAEASRTKSKEPGAELSRTQSAKTAAERCSKSCDNIKRWHKNPKGIQCHNKRVSIPGVGDAHAKVLKQLCNNPLAGHFGFKRYLELIQRYYSWPGMAKEVQQYIITCSIYRRIKLVRHKKHSKMQPLPMLTELFLD